MNSSTPNPLSMAIIDRVRKSDTTPAKEPKKTTKKAVVKPASDVVVQGDAMNAKKRIPLGAQALIRKPHVSEKASRLAQSGNVYTFDVPVDAEKIAIKKAIEALYNVRVLSVHTVRGIGKVVHRGRVTGTRNNWKKALVKVAPGQTIDIYTSAS